MMLRLTSNIINKTLNIAPRASLSTAPAEKWDLFAAVAVERRPKIVPQMNEIEKAFQKQLSSVELETSCKSDYEIRHEADLKQAELLKKGDDVDATLKQTAQDFADASLEEMNTFKFGNASTADKLKNIKSLNRKLDKHLLLLTEQQIGDKKFFLPPQGMRQDGESLRQAAERVLKDSIGSEIKTQIYSNAPSGFYKYKYPKNIQNEKNTVGAKVFIYFARYNKGDLPEMGINYKWLDRDEMRQEIPEKYLESLEMCLVDE